MAHLSHISKSVGLITLQNPPVNALSAAVRQGVVDTVQRALSDPNIKSVVICGQNGIFCGGADIGAFSKPMTGPALIPMIHAIEASSKPVVAAIEGVALGGGLEVALGCHYRITHSKAKLGLPEVTLGLLPAATGSQRLPRLIGVPAALDLITTGRHITAAEALKLGIVDQVTDGSVVDAAVRFARSVEGKPLQERRICNMACPPHPDLRGLFEEVMQKVRRRSRGAIAPVACVQAVRAATTATSYQDGLKRESELMMTLMTSGQSRALQYAFFAQRTAGKWSTPNGARWDTTTPRAVGRVAVIGLGTMGRGIAVSLAQAGIPVVAVEMEEKPLAAAKRAITGTLERGAQRRGVAAPLDLISYGVDLRAAADADLVIEAVFEDMDLKKQVFRRLADVCGPGTLLCSNTSSLDVDQLAAQTRSPELVVGMHFFSPAHVMKLLEVIHGTRSSPEAVATAMHLGKRMGKVCVAVGNCWGFVGNRMLQPYKDNSYFLVEEGAAPEEVDRALEEFGFAMGAFRMSDLAGLDVGWRVRMGKGLVRRSPSEPETRSRRGRRYSPLGDLLCEEGRFGQKTGLGWYRYESGSREAVPDPWVRRFLEDYRLRHGLVARRVDHQEVLERCLYTMINEGFRILDEGVAAGPEDIDVIYLFGYGWPRHRGGPMFYAHTVGLARVAERLDHHQGLNPDVPGLEPCRLLRQLVARGSPHINTWRDVIRQVRSQL